MSNYEHLDIQHSDRVATVTIQHPPVNALSPAVVKELGQAFGELASNNEVGAVVLTGAGPKIFVAGADIKAMASMDPAGAEQLARDGQAAIDQLASMPKLTICAINGLALGGGLELAMACDLVVTTSSAQFGTPEVNIGLFPMMIMPVLQRNIGRKKLLEMMYTGDKLRGDEALALGMVNYAVSVDQLDQTVNELTRKITRKSQVIYKLGREAFYTMADQSQPEALEYLQDMLSKNLHTADAKEGLQAFLEKRTPVWTDQ